MGVILGKSLIEFNRLYKEYDALYHHVAVKIGMSDSAFCIFYTICELGAGCLQKDICNVMLSSKQTINSSISKLEKEGYIRLEQGRGRDKHIYLTPKGEDLVQERIVPVIEMEKVSMEQLLPEERTQMLEITRKHLHLLKKNLKNLKKL